LGSFLSVTVSRARAEKWGETKMKATMAEHKVASFAKLGSFHVKDHSAIKLFSLSFKWTRMRLLAEMNAPFLVSFISTRET